MPKSELRNAAPIVLIYAGYQHARSIEHEALRFAGLSAPMEDSLRRALEEEYKILQAKWDDFDRRAQTIRGWFVAGAGAAIGFSGQLNATWAPIALAGAGLNVWLIEAVWKSWQHAYGKRLREIEDHFRNDRILSSAFQIEASWLATYSPKPGSNVNWCKVWDEFWSRSMMVGYAPFVIVCVLIALYQAGYITVPVR